jgi:hypothetical protein
MTRQINPFFFETPADRWSFTDREELIPRIQKILKERGRRVLFYGRRRMGKTSLIDNATAGARPPLLSVDLSTVVSLTEVATKLINQLPQPQGSQLSRALKLIQDKLDGVAFELWKFSFKADIRKEAGQANLEQTLDFIAALGEAEDVAYTVWFDEFQDIWKLGGDEIEWRLRGVTQKHKHVNYFFSGSDHRLLKRMTNPKAAFFKQLETVEVGPIDAALLSKWVDGRMHRGGVNRTGLGQEIVSLGGPCTGDIVKLAKTVFDVLASDNNGAHAVQRAMDDIALRQLHNEHATFWRERTLLQRALLRALADGRQPLSIETGAMYGIRSASSGGAALEALVDSQLLTRDLASNQILFDGPFFKRWVAANGVID